MKAQGLKRPPSKKCQKRLRKPARNIAQENIKCEKTKGILFFNSIIVHLPKFT